MVARHYTACVRSLVQTIHALPSAIIKDSPRRTLSTTRLVVRHPPQTRSRYSIQRSEQQRDPVIPCSDSDVIDYFRRLLPPLEFPHDVALRMITHSSWRDGVQGHNTRQSFIGRRVLHAYLMTFLHAHTTLTPTPPLTKPPTEPTQDLKISGLPAPDPTLDQDYDKLVQRILHTRALGDHVGGAWALERVMRWVPNTNDPGPNQEGASSGFHKIRGTTVEAVVGGVFHQFGGVAAHRLFHTRLLPHVSFLLPTEYRKPAQEACDFLGGPAAPLLPRSQQVSPKAAAASG